MTNNKYFSLKGLASQNGGGDKRNSTKEESRMSRRDRSPAYRSRDQRGSKSHDHRNDSNSKRPKDRRYHEEEYDSSKRRKHKQQESGMIDAHYRSVAGTIKLYTFKYLYM